MIKGIMVHYLPGEFDGNVFYAEYKKVVIAEHPDYKHIFFPTANGREGIEIITHPQGDSKKGIL